jgi:hypothetical protein
MIIVNHLQFRQFNLKRDGTFWYGNYCFGYLHLGSRNKQHKHLVLQLCCHSIHPPHNDIHAL